LNKKYYTTGEIAKITGLSLKTVQNYCTKGKIVSEQTPISNYRRISHFNFSNFLEENKLSLNSLQGKEYPKVLIVDDDNIIVNLLQRIFEKISRKIIIERALNGYEGCIKAGILIPDIILLDLQMPKADGFEVCKNIRNIENTKHAELIIITGYASLESLERLEGYHIRKVLTKPVDLKKINIVLKEALYSVSKK
jgi:CheY-like chemotaxis protein